MASRSKKPAPIPSLQRPPAEILHAEELQRLRDRDATTPRPQNWHLTPRSVLDFILGGATSI